MISLSAFALLGGILMSTLWNARPKGDGGTSRNHSGGGTGPNKPGAVQSAVILFYISLGIGVIRSVLEASTLAEMAPPWFLMLISYLVLGVMWLLVFMIGRGRSWARTTFLVLFVVGIPFSIQPLLLSLAVFPISGFAFVGQTLLQIVVLVLLYQKKSSEWFRRTATSNERPL